MVRAAYRRLIVAAAGAAAAGCYASHEDSFPDANPPETFGNSCASDGECDDGEPCNGAEWCNLRVGLCFAGTQIPDFTQCRTPDGRYASCVDGVCDLRWEEICIPAGPFVRGVDREDYRGPGGWGWIAAWPKHIVTLSEYCIDKYEVTNRRLRRCAEAGRCRPPVNDVTCNQGLPYTMSDRYLDHPATFLGYYDATGLFADLQQLCGFEGKRPPTEAEWEKAARGGCEIGGDPTICDAGDERKYPWGDARPSRDLVAGTTDFIAIPPVGSRPAGASPYGVMDMAGSLSEATMDCDGIPEGGSFREGTAGYLACAAGGCVDPWMPPVPPLFDTIHRGGGARGGGCWVGYDEELTVYARDIDSGTGGSGGRCVRSNAVLRPMDEEQ
ncbi:MAG: SUMF1/EgtB/PvdO family nonheme iron enzyme [Myxococcota bacterium]|nr:SUMF1/EgtB/PvdO family nonheme iron enzyme [Myxococcota bacterium]